MKIFRSILIICIVALTGTTYAQDAKAKAILDKVSNKTRQYTSLTSEFTFTLEDKVAEISQTQEGMLKMKGKKYFIKLDANEIYSDGKTRWTYNSDMNEVYIDDADGGDETLNPAEIYTIWETGFKHYYDSETSLNGKTADVINLIPNDPKDKAFHTVKVYINRADELAKIEILGKQGDNYTYLVKTFKTNVNYDDNAFVFNNASHPGVEVIDNR